MSDSDRRVETPPEGSDAHLVIARPSDAGARAYCRARLEGDRPDAMPITVLADPRTTDRRPESDPDGPRGVIVAVGDEVRGSATATPEMAPAETHHGTVSAPGDLGAVGRTIDRYMQTWATQGRRPVVCVDSLNGLLEHASIQGSYRFLYVLRRRIGDVGGEIHVHVDPSAHEEEILRTFFSVFDRVVAFEDGGPPLL